MSDDARSTGIRYQFGPTVDMDEVQNTLRLAVLAAEGMFGEARVELGITCRTCPIQRQCDVVAEPEIGRMFYGVFLTYLRTNLGDDAVQVNPLRYRHRTRPSDGHPDGPSGWQGWDGGS